MYVLGIDVGSTSSKAVIFKDGAFYAGKVIQAGTGTSGPERVLNEIMASTGLSMDNIAQTVATGYGRFSLDFADKQISEISWPRQRRSLYLS